MVGRSDGPSGDGELSRGHGIGRIDGDTFGGELAGQGDGVLPGCHVTGTDCQQGEQRHDRHYQEECCGDRSQDEQPAAFPTTVLQLAEFVTAAADPGNQELAGDLVEVEIAAALSAHEPRLAKALERLIEQARRNVALLFLDALKQVAGRYHVACAGRGDHLPEQSNRGGPQLSRHAVERLTQIVLQKPLRALLGEQRLRVVALPQPQADRLHFGQADVAGAEALRQHRHQTVGEGRGKLAREMIGVALERSPDDCRQRVGRWRGDAQRLVDELRAGRQQLLDLAQIVLAEGEEDLDWERPAQQPNEELDQTPLCITGPGLVEQGYDLLELVEDQQRPMPLARRADAFLERVHRQHGPRRRFLVERKDGRQQLRLVVVRAPDPLDDELFGCARLHAQSLGRKAESYSFRDQAGVDEGGLARAGVAIEQHAPVHGDKAGQAVRLLPAREEDRVVEVAERVNPAVRDAWDGCRKLAHDGDG